ncbi:MAG TPA: M28 family peptidase [Candidatus Thalassarchaeaceae archaeon]|nr:M28 family peptidase [Candidatus Thalassarchaeaceae archaeon]
MTRGLGTIIVFFLLLNLTGTIGTQVESETPQDWPEGNDAYDNMLQMADFGYRKIDSDANKNARNWIAEELDEMGFEVEKQTFTTNECSDCENIVATINGTLDDEWIVVGAHHDAICYSPPPLIGVTYAGCRSDGAYDDGTGSGALLEIASVLSKWDGTPERTWKLGWWDYEEWQGSDSSEGGGMGSIHFVDSIPNGTTVTYLNLDMFGLNWPVPTPAASQLSGCDEEFWTLYQFTSPVDDWSYYEDRGLNVTDEMRERADFFQTELIDINEQLEHPSEWVRVIDDTKGNSDHFNFIMAGHTATWLRGQHQYIMEEGDTCEQTPKHAQTDSVATLNRMGGGRGNVESGLQTGLDIIASYAWMDWNAESNNSEENEPENEESFLPLPIGFGAISLVFIMATIIKRRNI